jgi:hypothetical protein
LHNADAVDEKIGAWFQAAPVVATLLIGLLGFLKDGINGLVAVIAAIGLTLFAVAMLLFFLAQNPRPYRQGLSWKDVADDVANDELSDADFHYRYAYYTAEQTIPPNEAITLAKVARFRWATALFATSVAFLLLAALIALLRSH